MKKYIYSPLLTVLLLSNMQTFAKASENEESWSDWLDVACAITKQGIDAAKPYVDKGVEMARPYVSQGVEFAKTKIEEGKEVIAKAKAKAAAEKSLWEGIRSNNLDLVRSSLEKSAFVDCTGHRGQTPLHHAATTGNYELTELLVSFGADIEKQDEFKLNSIALAQKNGHHTLANYLQKVAAKRKAQIAR